ncbi:hypothetical protein Bca52824_061047 [Brassica carinata]|uniref:Hydroxyproline O-arabinosyltransferase-like domain-containing protein n=1 Tax=Brassica carinata TaxID=52824 RepID=A0A8X7UH37_BRACI|nr:hypothetical protein Bca52824_061047 [Brassica carinata]
MGCGGTLFYPLLITLSVALITYNILISSNAPLKQGFPLPPPTTTHEKNRRLFHTAVTASDSVYNTWQCRVMYYWFKKAKASAGPGSEMGGFTRILHNGKPDKYMDEIPTFVAQPLPSGMDQGYVVLNRPWAFVQWLQQADIKEDYVLMSEPDHVIVKPIPNLAKDGFGYEKVLRKYYPEERGPVTNIDPIGNSPVIVGKEALKKIAPTWMNVSLAMKKDPEADKAFGWVLEMYAYAVSSALHGVSNVLHKDFMIQPPWDKEVGDKYIIHYTYGCDFDMKVKISNSDLEWRFDKRSYIKSPPPKNLTMPPPGVPQSVVTLVKMVNEATANLPDWGIIER